jgi:mannose/fructose/N-acetylgalactosamine-specific phosphotransferase system component IIC
MATEVRESRTSGAAIASLVLGIVGLTVFPLIPSVLALVFGSRARDEIRADPGVSGEGLATAGVMLGWIGVAITLLGLALFLVGLAVFFAV